MFKHAIRVIAVFHWYFKMNKSQPEFPTELYKMHSPKCNLNLHTKAQGIKVTTYQDYLRIKW